MSHVGGMSRNTGVKTREVRFGPRRPGRVQSGSCLHPVLGSAPRLGRGQKGQKPDGPSGFGTRTNSRPHSGPTPEPRGPNTEPELGSVSPGSSRGLRSAPSPPGASRVPVRLPHMTRLFVPVTRTSVRPGPPHGHAGAEPGGFGEVSCSGPNQNLMWV